MKRRILISTKAYKEPLETFAMWDDSGSVLSIRWKEDHEGQTALYDLSFDKASGIASINRSGDIKSVMTFDTSRKTVSQFHTPYGTIEMGITTEYIKIPSLLERAFEISYEIEGGAEELQKNIFTITLI